nr:MATE family efflux transporter [uncultured Amphritea sp.]
MSTQSTPLKQQLFHMTWPMLIGMLAISSGQLVDSAFIGQLGAEPLAVVGFSMPIYQLIIGIQVGLGIATTAVISMALGANKTAYAKQLGALIIATGFVLISLLCLLLWATQSSIFSLLGADITLLPLVRVYWFPWLISCWLGAMLYFGFSLFRAYGQTRFPGIVLVLTSLINILLDPLFIFTFDMGLAGAAWATVGAFGLGCMIIFVAIYRQRWILLPSTLATIRHGLQRLFSFTAPAMLSQFLPPLTALIATGLVASHGNAIVAAWGLGSRIEFFSIIIVLSLTMSMPPIIGRLRGRQQFAQIDQLMRIAIGFVIVFQLFIALIILFVSAPLSHLLTSDTQTADNVHQYLLLVPLSYAGLGISMITISACSAIGMPAQAVIISVIRLFGCYLPLLWIGSVLAGPTGLFSGAMLGNMLAGYLSWLRYQQQFKRLIAQSDDDQDSQVSETEALC